jgi:amino acid transporter
MTRCPNCGASRSSQVCEVCGLEERAAALAFRRRLMNHTAILLVGALAFLPAGHLYPPLELDAMLIFVGVLFFLTLAMAVWLDFRARRHRPLELLRRIFRALVPVPWLLAALVFLNGQFDSAPPVNRVTRVVGKFTMPGTLRSSRLMVISWREGRRYERVPVTREDFLRFERGDAVEVRMREGFLGIPWVYGVYQK